MPCPDAQDAAGPIPEANEKVVTMAIAESDRWFSVERERRREVHKRAERAHTPGRTLGRTRGNAAGRFLQEHDTEHQHAVHRVGIRRARQPLPEDLRGIGSLQIGSSGPG